MRHLLSLDAFEMEQSRDISFSGGALERRAYSQWLCGKCWLGSPGYHRAGSKTRDDIGLRQKVLLYAGGETRGPETYRRVSESGQASYCVNIQRAQSLQGRASGGLAGDKRIQRDGHWV